MGVLIGESDDFVRVLICFGKLWTEELEYSERGKELVQRLLFTPHSSPLHLVRWGISSEALI